MLLLALALITTGPRQLPSVEALAAQLTRGRLVLQQVRFQPNSDGLAADNALLLRQAARAINTTPGRFVVFVPSERVVSFPPDTVMTRRRRVAAFRALLSAGANPAHLLGPADGPSPSLHSIDPVQTGGARIELIRIDPATIPGPTTQEKPAP